MHITISTDAAANNDVRVYYCGLHIICSLTAQCEIKWKTNDGFQLVRTYVYLQIFM